MSVHGANPSPHPPGSLQIHEQLPVHDTPGVVVPLGVVVVVLVVLVVLDVDVVDVVDVVVVTGPQSSPTVTHVPSVRWVASYSVIGPPVQAGHDEQVGKNRASGRQAMLSITLAYTPGADRSFDVTLPMHEQVTQLGVVVVWLSHSA